MGQPLTGFEGRTWGGGADFCLRKVPYNPPLRGGCMGRQGIFDPQSLVPCFLFLIIKFLKVFFMMIAR